MFDPCGNVGIASERFVKRMRPDNFNKSAQVAGRRIEGGGDSCQNPLAVLFPNFNFRFRVMSEFVHADFPKYACVILSAAIRACSSASNFPLRILSARACARLLIAILTSSGSSSPL